MVGQTIYAHAGATFRTSGPNVIQDLGGQRRHASVAARSPPTPTIFRKRLVVSRGLLPSNLAAALWGLELIDDPYTRALQGEIIYTGILLHDFAVLRSSAHSPATVSVTA